LTAALSLSFWILPSSLAAVTPKQAHSRATTARTPAAGDEGSTATQGASAAQGEAVRAATKTCCAAGATHVPAVPQGRHGEALAGRPAPKPPRASSGENEGEAGGSVGCCTTGRRQPAAPPAPARLRGVEEGEGRPVPPPKHRTHGRVPAAAPAGAPVEATGTRGARQAGGETAGDAAGEPEGEGQAGATPVAQRRERPKGKHHKGGREPKPPQRLVDPPRADIHAPVVATVAATPSQIPAAPVAVPAKAPAPSTPQLVGGRPQTPSTGLLGRLSRRAPVRANRTPAATALAPAILAPVAGPAPAPAGANGNGTAVPAQPKQTHQAQSQLVTTVTRFINVIPAFVRVVIAALILLALGLGISSRVASMRARRLGRQRSQLLEDVGLLQAALLPPAPPRVGPVATSSAYRPASGPGAGGDFYDVFALADGQLAVIVGDVSGHGRDALPQTTLVRYTLRAYLEAGMSPRTAIQMAAPVLERQLGDSFATVVLATYHPRDRTLVYACAGHPPPLIVGSEPLTLITACSSPPIGAGQPTGTRQTVVSLPGEALICLYTDGILDARVHGDLFGCAATRAPPRCSTTSPRSPTSSPTTWLRVCFASTATGRRRSSRPRKSNSTGGRWRVPGPSDSSAPAVWTPSRSSRS
jgi:hypothetical protein